MEPSILHQSLRTPPMNGYFEENGSFCTQHSKDLHLSYQNEQVPEQQGKVLCMILF